MRKTAIDQNLTKMIKRDQNYLPVPPRSPTFAEKSNGKEMDYDGADARNTEVRA